MGRRPAQVNVAGGRQGRKTNRSFQVYLGPACLLELGGERRNNMTTKKRSHLAMLAACLAIALAFLSGPAHAQKPRPEQIDAIRTNCKADFARLCPGVPTDGRALLCLRKHTGQLAASCQRAVDAVK
jgi:hypothetical protein